MTDINDMAEAALRRLRHSIGTSAGMHKMQIRRRAARMRAEWDAGWGGSQDVTSIKLTGPHGWKTGDRVTMRWNVIYFPPPQGGAACTPPPPNSPPSA